MNIHACNWLAKQDYVSLNRILIAYAKARLKPLHWNHNHEGATKGMSPNDFVKQALEKFMTGVRTWEPDGIDPIKCLKGIISSDISNAITSKENKTSSALSLSEIENEHEIPIISYFPDPESQLIADDLQAKIKKAVSEIDDPDGILSIVCDATIDEQMLPREIHEAFDIAINQVYNALKRIRRVSKKVYEKQ